jgi:hypothetical protein
MGAILRQQVSDNCATEEHRNLRGGLRPNNPAPTRQA